MPPSKETRRAEGRRQPGRNPGQRNRVRRQSRVALPSNLARVNTAARTAVQTRFTALLHHVDFERLVALVCSCDVGAVYCIEASRLARNGRDWHHLIDLCALAGSLVIDPDGAYDPRLVNRLLLGLKGTMLEYELSLMRQRGLAARDSKAQRGEFRFVLPPGFCWGECGQDRD
jgi:DNA invertase Pin-like site-specific DNA recombinase